MKDKTNKSQAVDFESRRGEERKSEIKEKRICQLFSKVMGEEYSIKTPVKKLGGMNNDNYRIDTDTKDFVFRLPGKGSNESVNRDNEFTNSRIASEIGLNCDTIYFDRKSGLKVTEYIDNAETLTIETADKERNMEFMAHALKTLHNSNRKFYRDFKPFDEIEDYKKTIITHDENLLENYKELDVVVDFLEGEVEKLSIEYVPCHLDAWPENFIISGNDVYLIDWEYSANYDRLWDVVSIPLECEYSRAEEELFYNKYFEGEPSEIERLKMKVLKVLMDIYWSMWSLSKVSCGDIDLYDYSLGRYNRGISNLAALDYKR